MSIGINDALSKLYLKLGGNPQDIRENKSITDYIDDLGDVLKSLAELPGVSSSDNGKILKVIDGTWAKGDAPTELPTVSSSDNGKFLGVSEGSWGKVDALSDEPFIIKVDEDSEYTITLNKTYAEIETAYKAGKRILADVHSDIQESRFYGPRQIMSMSYAITQINDHISLNFMSFEIGDGVIYTGTFTLNTYTESCAILYADVSYS